MNELIRKILDLAKDVEPKEGQWKPEYEALEAFAEGVLALIPEGIWEERKCDICHGNGFVQHYSVNEADYGRTWIEDCSCIIEYEAQLEEQYEAYLAEKSKGLPNHNVHSEDNVEKVE